MLIVSPAPPYGGAASARILEKAGSRQEGRMRQSVFLRDDAFAGA